MLKEKIVLFILMILTVTLYGQNSLIYVNPGQSIQNAINNVDDGGTVVVNSGEYDVSNLSWSNKHIKLVTSPLDPAVIRGYSAIVLESPNVNNNDLVSGFRFEYCVGQVGSAIKLMNGASPKIKNCSFKYNEANELGNNYGGAVYIHGALNQSNIPWFENCEFNSNMVIANCGNNGGGAIAINGGAKITN